MTKKISNANVFKMAKDFRAYVENNYKVPYKFTYNGIEFFTMEMQDIMTYVLLNLSSGCTVGDTGWCSNANGDTINENVLKDDYLDQARRVHQYVLDYGKMPNYVTTKKSKKRVNIDLYSYCVAKILVFYNENKILPNYCNYNSNAFKTSNNTPSTRTYSEQIYDYFCQKFGKVNTIDDALAKIKGRGYGYYYDNKYSNKQTIDRLASNGEKPNCTDSAQMMWHVGKAMGYDVRAIHVMCRSGVGHVRLQFYKPRYGWFNRDPAAVIDGECVECIWCGTGTYLATNPQWFLNDLNK